MSTELISLSTTAAKGYEFGLRQSHNLGDPNNDIDFAVGECVSDDGIYLMRNAAVFTKALDAAWAIGSGNGGLDTGTKQPNTTYFPYMIRRASDGAIDFIYSVSATSPSLPSGWTAKRRRRAIMTDGAGNIVQGTWRGKRFVFDGVQVPVDDTNISSIGALYQLSGPVGIEHIAIGVINPGQAAPGPVDLSISLRSPVSSYQTPAGSPFVGTFRGIVGAYDNGGGYAFASSSYFEELCDTLAQVKMQRTGSYNPGAGFGTTVQQLGFEEID